MGLTLGSSVQMRANVCNHATSNYNLVTLVYFI